MVLKLSGVIPPMITPLDENERLDKEGTKRLVEHLLEGGVNGIFLLGSSGEFVALKTEVKIELMEEVKREVGKEVLLLAGVSEPGTELTLEAIKTAGEIGMDGVVVTPPYYFPLCKDGVLEHYRFLGKNGHVPVVLYNIPLTTGVSIDLDTIQTLAEENLISGIKDSSGDFIHFRKLVRAITKYPNCNVMQGHEALVAPSLMVGADGMVPAYANVFPQMYVDLIKAFGNGDVEKVLSLQDQIDKCIATYSYGSVYGSIKFALKKQGICQEFLTKPLQNPNLEQKEKITMVLKEIMKK